MLIKNKTTNYMNFFNSLARHSGCLQNVVGNH